MGEEERDEAGGAGRAHTRKIWEASLPAVWTLEQLQWQVFVLSANGGWREKGLGVVRGD